MEIDRSLLPPPLEEGERPVHVIMRRLVGEIVEIEPLVTGRMPNVELAS